jgi:hypothetical protein
MNIPDFDYASLYPTTMRNFYDERIRLKRRRKKLDKILNNINNENII